MKKKESWDKSNFGRIKFWKLENPQGNSNPYSFYSSELADFLRVFPNCKTCMEIRVKNVLI
jgi:hypothetical protein